MLLLCMFQLKPRSLTYVTIENNIPTDQASINTGMISWLKQFIHLVCSDPFFLLLAFVQILTGLFLLDQLFDI